MAKTVIINKIGDKVKELQEQTGCTKTWIAKQLGYSSKQALDGAINSKNPTIETLVQFATFFKCDVKDLYDVIIDFTDGVKVVPSEIPSAKPYKYGTEK